MANPPRQPVRSFPLADLPIPARRSVGCALLAKDGRIISVTRSFAQMVGQPASLFFGQSIFQFLIPVSKWKSEQSLIDGGTTQVTCHGYLAKLTIHKIAPGAAMADSYIGLLHDLNSSGAQEQIPNGLRQSSEPSRAEKELVHEIVGPLNAIANTAELLLADDEFGEGGRDALQLMRDEAYRLGHLLRGFLSTAGNQHTIITGAQVVQLIEKCVMLGNAETNKRGIKCQLSCDSDLPAISGDTIGLTQVLVNLIKNAFDATPVDREINVTVKRGQLAASAALEIRIADQGPGISERDLPRVFEPFFTTKKAGQGTGLGLAISRRIVSEHHGELTLNNMPGAGTAAKILLPVFDPNRKAEAMCASSRRVRDSRERLPKRRKVQG